jgi:hypothetical protein
MGRKTNRKLKKTRDSGQDQNDETFRPKVKVKAAEAGRETKSARLAKAAETTDTPEAKDASKVSTENGDNQAKPAPEEPENNQPETKRSSIEENHIETLSTEIVNDPHPRDPAFRMDLTQLPDYASKVMKRVCIVVNTKDGKQTIYEPDVTSMDLRVSEEEGDADDYDENSGNGSNKTRKP